jgi:hypothetical protein
MSTVNTQLNTAGTPIIVAEGGTGVATMTTAYAPVCAGTTATGALQVASTGLSTSGFVLTSNGSSALPSFQANTGGITTTSVSLTVAQIQGAHSSPVTLVAAQGSNTVIVVLNLTFLMVVAGVAYSLTGNCLMFGFGGLASAIQATLAALPISGAAFAGVTNTTLTFNCSPFTGSITSGQTVNPLCASGATNTALVFSSNTNAVTGGTGSGNSTVYITYMVVTV